MKVSDAPDRSRYEIHADDGELLGFADYRLSPDVITFVHAEVDPAHRGGGVASTLARESLDDAARRGLKVVPSCPYYAQWIRRHPDYQALVAA